MKKRWVKMHSETQIMAYLRCKCGAHSFITDEPDTVRFMVNTTIKIHNTNCPEKPRKKR